MKVHKTLSRLAAQPDDPAELRRVARALGDELSRRRLEVLRDFRAGLARAESGRETFAAGYVAGLLDIAAEVTTHIQADDDASARRELVGRAEVRAMMLELRVQAEAPATLASRLGLEPVDVVGILDELELAGLVQPYAATHEDKHMRPYRLTRDGQRTLDEALASVSPEVEAGIRIAIGMFRYMCQHQASPASALREIAEEELHDPAAAAMAVHVWAEESQDAGLITELDPPLGATRAPGDELYHVTLHGNAGTDARADRLWQHVPVLLSQLQARPGEQVPLFVRTNSAGWGAWAYALQNQDETGESRTILDGDLLARTVTPPGVRFDLIYDSRATLEADQDQPAMRELIEHADERFLVSSNDDEPPEGFTLLSPASPGSDDPSDAN
ncbi:hypothetical protein [Haliangium sp.]|uniref:hypothetical protein n=1 Tax=Haliangium sp. TaxID=2663208 RepID=UPI003D1168D2